VTKPFLERTIFEKLSRHLGVAYAYEGHDASSAGDGSRTALTAERLATLPSEYVRAVYNALACGDIDSAVVAAERVLERDEPLGSALVASIKAYEIDQLLTLIERVEPTA
jgi:hypothetical protein